MAAPNPSRFQFGWTKPGEIAGYSQEAYEDRVPFLPGMTAAQVGEWHDLMRRAEKADGRRGIEMIRRAWEEHVQECKYPPDEVANKLKQKIAEYEQKQYELKMEMMVQEARSKFNAEVQREEAVSTDVLSAIDCSIDTTRDMFLAAGYGAKWFLMDSLTDVHKAMARRLRDNGLLETVKTYDNSMTAIKPVHRVKGT